MIGQIAIISIGSNMGDRKANCLKGIDALSGSTELELTGLSKFYETEPIDYLDQSWFVNAAARIETTLEPLRLLERLKTIEKMIGRVASDIRFGPRLLDLDVIFFGNQIIHSADLIIPHPRMHQRRFVLKPICDIDPLIEHPILKKNVLEMLKELSAIENQRVVDL